MVDFLISSGDNYMEHIWLSTDFLWLKGQKWMRRVGHIAHMGDRRNEYKILVRKPERK
jgi:hypothetical protein